MCVRIHLPGPLVAAVQSMYALYVCRQPEHACGTWLFVGVQEALLISRSGVDPHDFGRELICRVTGDFGELEEATPWEIQVRLASASLACVRVPCAMCAVCMCCVCRVCAWARDCFGCYFVPSLSARRQPHENTLVLLFFG